MSGAVANEKCERIVHGARRFIVQFGMRRFVEGSIRVIRSAVLPLLPALLVAVSCSAQTTGRLSGTVQNLAGDAVAGAVVTLSIPDWAGTYASTITSSTGAFSFRLLKPATYDVTVEAPTFSKQ